MADAEKTDDKKRKVTSEDLQALIAEEMRLLLERERENIITRAWKRLQEKNGTPLS